MEKKIKVADRFRTNPLSFSGGGVTVIAQYHDGTLYEYTDIKYPEAYMRKIRANEKVKDVWVA